MQKTGIAFASGCGWLRWANDCGSGSAVTRISVDDTFYSSKHALPCGGACWVKRRRNRGIIALGHGSCNAFEGGSTPRPDSSRPGELHAAMVLGAASRA